MNLEKIKKIHCIGIGGIGVSAAAKFFLSRGVAISGSDVCSSAITQDLEKRGVKIFYGHKAENVAADVDLIIYSPAVPKDNPERLKGILELSYPEFLGELSKNYYTIAVSGTHGKSTTTAMLGLILEAAGFDPLVIVGSQVPGWELGNIRLPINDFSNCHPERSEGSVCGKKIEDSSAFGLRMTIGSRSNVRKQRFFVVEACEHQANMLNMRPQAVVVTNMEPDHLDFYGNFDNVKSAFQKFIQLVPRGGLVIFNGDREAELDWNYARPSVLKLIWQMFFKVRPRWRSFGFGEDNNYRAVDWKTMPGHQEFEIQSRYRELPRWPSGELGDPVRFRGYLRDCFAPRNFLWGARNVVEKAHVRLQIPSQFNAYNALAAMAAALELGAPVEICQKVLANFKGIWRRFEVVGEIKTGASGAAAIISDYGHHPTAIRETIQAAREFYPSRRVVLVYQPHQHHRTKMLFTDFAAALAMPDVLILSDIYDVAGREETGDQDINSLKLLEAIKASGGAGEYYYGGDLVETERLAREKIKENDVILVMGAGDVDTMARNLVVPTSS